MAMLNPYQQYAQDRVTTASPEELTLMLYKGAVKFISLSINAIDKKEMDEANNNILKAQTIYNELLVTLDMNYDISKNLASLYEYLINLLVQANIKKDISLLEEALGMGKMFVEIWEESIRIYRSAKAPGQIEQIG